MVYFAFERSLRRSVRNYVTQVAIIFQVVRSSNLVALIRLHAFLGLVGYGNVHFFFFAASSLSTLGHEGPNCNNGNDDSNGRENDRFAEECVEELLLKGGLFVCTGRVYLFDIHLQVGVGMRSGQLFEPLVTS